MPPRKKLVILRRAKKLYTTLPGFLEILDKKKP
jgi:hypothetical protein